MIPTRCMFNLTYGFGLYVLADDIIELFCLLVKVETLIFISGRCSAISSAKDEKSSPIYNLVKNCETLKAL